MDTINILIKPSSKCNLGCKYCFYSDLSSYRTLNGNGMMTEKTLERIMQEAFSISSRQVIFAFQGGEPTLAGLEFFKRFIEYESGYKPHEISVHHSIQTNGVLINEEWAEFFCENKFLVGLSMDGNGDLHNMNRVNAADKGTFTKVCETFEMLKRKNVDTNILCVVTNQLARRAYSVYTGMKTRGCRFMQFIPCIDPPDKVRGGQEYSLTPDRYIVFLKTLFDLWYNDWERKDYVSIRLFDDYVHILADRSPGSCASSGSCGQYIVIESDGGIYPCDFYTEDKWYIGNINSMPLTVLIDSEKAKEFINESFDYPEKCASCCYFNVCRGGCKRDRYYENGETNNYFCSTFIEFFDYSIDRLKHIASLERTLRRRSY